jgi:hypothetical protein
MSITLAANSGQGYIAIASEATSRNADGTPNVLTSPRYFSGPMGSASGGFNQLTEYSTQAEAEAMAVNLPLDGRWDLPEIVEGRFIRLYHRSITGSSYALREFYPRRLVEADDIRAETIQTLHLGAHIVTADKIFVLDLSALTANIGQLTISSASGAPAWIYQGTGTGDAPITGLKIFNSGGIGKLSTYNATVEQVTFDTDGKLKAGAGYVVLDASGITIEAPASASYNVVSAIDWHNTANAVDLGRIYGWYDNVSNFNRINLEALRSGTTRPGAMNLFVNGWFGGGSTVSIDLFGGTAALESAIDLSALHIDVSGTLNAQSGLNVGGATGAGTGEISTSGNIAVGSVISSTTRAYIKGVDATSSNYSFIAQNSSGTNIIALRNDNRIGFLGAAVVARPTVTGSRATDAWRTSLMAGLSALGLITDSSSA